MKNTIASMIITTILSFLVVAFYQWNINPGEWGDKARVAFLIFTIYSWVMIWAGVLILKE